MINLTLNLMPGDVKNDRNRWFSKKVETNLFRLATELSFYSKHFPLNLPTSNNHPYAGENRT